jgi:ribose 5-phosphate isomerase B
VNIAVGADHAGMILKAPIIEHLKKAGHIVIDVGSHTTAAVDYPDIAVTLCKRVMNNEADFGILCCGTGVGMAMAANRIHGIRAAACTETYTATMSRSHNNANVLCLGGRIIAPGLALHIADAFLSTEFQGGRHATRIEKMMALECS